METIHRRLMQGGVWETSKGEAVLEQVENTIATHQLFGAANPAVLMVSGGSDSTALAYIMAQLRERGQVGPLAMLHVNHKLRGADSEADQAFVEQLAAALDIPLFTCEVDVALLVEETGANMEAVARNERYLAAHEALESLCRHEAVPTQYARIVTAHTANDRVENFYMRSIVGTGPGGFRSMKYANGPVVRPLLDVSRESLREYLQELAAAGEVLVRDAQGALWREDATNAHTDKFRAYVRHNMVPVAKERNPRLLETLTRTMNLIADEDDLLDELAKAEYERHLSFSGDGLELGETPDECLIAPEFGQVARPLQRRVVVALLQQFLGAEARIETAAVEAVLAAFSAEGAPIGGYVENIQGNLAVSANKQGVRIEHMNAFRARRNRA